MSVDPRWRELRDAAREEHRLPDKVKGQVWERLSASVAAGETGPRLEPSSARGAGAGAGTMVIWVIAAVAATVVVVLGVERLSERTAQTEVVEALNHKAESEPQRAETRALVRDADHTEVARDPQPPRAVTRPASRWPQPARGRAAKKSRPAQDGLREDPLQTELRILDQAERVLERGDGAAALRILARHEREFADGQLREDRAALRIRALCRTGKDAQARGELRLFRGTHPGSQHLRRIEQDCGAT